jgi:hypothetical protein
MNSITGLKVGSRTDVFRYRRLALAGERRERHFKVILSLQLVIV